VVSVAHFLPGFFFLVLSFQSLIKQQPIWQSYYDPAYAYLLGSASLLQGESSNLYQHPGFSTQILFAIYFFIAHLIRSPFENLSMDIVSNSEFYLNSLSALLAIICSLSLVYLSKQLLQSVGVAGTFLFFVVFFSFRSTFLPWSVLAMPESTSLISCVLLLSEFLRHNNQDSKAPFSKLDIWKLSFLISTALMSKISCLPFLLPFLFLLPKKTRVRTFFSTLLVSFAYTFPFIAEYKAITRWFLSIAISTNRYDVQTSDKLAQAKANYSSIFNALFGNYWIVLLIALLLVSLLSTTILQPKTKSLRSLVICSFVSVMLFLLMGYKQAQLKDFGLIGVSIGILVSSFFAHSYFRKGSVQKVIILVSFLSLIAMVPTVLKDFGNIQNQLHRIDRTNEDFESMQRILKSKPTILTYGVPNPPEALAFGNEWSSFAFSNEISAMYPNFLYFNIWNQITYKYNNEGGTEGYDCKTLMQNKSLIPQYILLSAFETNRLVKGSSFDLYGSMQIMFSNVTKSDEGYSVFTINKIMCFK
jgi:hypothetical protein